jgi:hypothetical protein
MAEVTHKNIIKIIKETKVPEAETYTEQKPMDQI